MIPVGKSTLGKMFDVFGNQLDESIPIVNPLLKPMHQKPVPFSKRITTDEIFLTGIKAIFIKGKRKKF